MADLFMFFPSVLWEVQNAYSIKDHTSCSFAFLGENWKLHFHRSPSTRGEFLQIFLKRIEPSSTINHFISTRTVLIGNNSYHCYETFVNIDTSSANEWCVWNEGLKKIKLFQQDSTLMFFCCIQPLTGWKEMLHNNADKAMKLSEDSVDVDSLREDLGNLFDKHVEADVTFNCKEENIHAHKAVISSRCGVLAAILQTDIKESGKGLIDIADVEPVIFRLFLRYLYTGDLPSLSLESALKLCFVADKYGMNALKKRCAFVLMDNLEVDASEDKPGSSIEEMLTVEIRSRLRNIKKVLCTDNWKYMTEEQLKMSMDAFYTFVKDIYREFNTAHENDIILLNQDVQRKKLKLMKSEENEK